MTSHLVAIGGATPDSPQDFLRRYWSHPNLDPGESFLRDYILNRCYLDREAATGVPSYEDIVAELSGEEEGGRGQGVGSGESEDEEAVEEMEQFERRYNFRFEEPDSAAIGRYPRSVAGSVRREDEARRRKRKEREERKSRVRGRGHHC